MALDGKIMGVLGGIIRGIAKIRIAGAESAMFLHWADLFTLHQRMTVKSSLIAIASSLFKSSFSLISSLVLFMTVGYFLKDETLGLGSFLAFFAAFGSISGAMLTFMESMTTALRIMPTYERLQPILKVLPEIHTGQSDPGEVQGQIELNHVSFGYQPDSLIIKDVSFTIKPKQFVAVVGPSGAGKSTLLRLLLGFERPSNGFIYYDEKDVNNIDIFLLRRQMGVVLQNGQLMSGSIFENIVGSSMFTLEDAWAAAERVGLAEDIKCMPMQMQTLVGEGGGGLSGGQRQRMLIARAIVNKPRILFFDEATSALDNKTQAIVSKSLENLYATRVVIAHRLSTIINADLILVLKDGALVEQGTYYSLMSENGIFAKLAKRQIV